MIFANLVEHIHQEHGYNAVVCLLLISSTEQPHFQSIDWQFIEAQLSRHFVTTMPFFSSQGDGDQLSADAQLAALQEQLVAVMLDNQHLSKFGF